MRAEVRSGYHFIGKGNISYPPGTIFEKLTEEEAADQMWKLKMLPSRKATEAEGIVEKTADKLPPIKSEEEIALEEAAAIEDEDKEDEDKKEEAAETDEEEASAAEGDVSPGDEDEPAEDEKEAEHAHDCCDEKEEEEATASKPKRKKRG